jgi:hypothetical protein
MAALTFIGREDVSERELFVVDAVRASDAISAPRPPGRYFACLLAWDATGLRRLGLLSWIPRPSALDSLEMGMPNKAIELKALGATAHSQR